jgi:hypothetical protein
VRLQAFGGEGIDTFHLQHPNASTNLETPFGYINVGGSLGTYGNKNPSVRRYIMNSIENVPAYIHTLKYDLAYKNKEPALNWDGVQQTYPHSFNYGFSDLSPSQILSMAKKVKLQEDIATNVYSATYKDFTGFICNEICRQELYCSLVHSQMDRIIDCRGKTLDREYLLDYLLSTVSNPWLP